MKTRSIKKSELKEKWYLLDAKGKRLGKLATEIASLLIGKDDVKTVSYLTPQNKVVVVNSKDVDIHPRKILSKMYYRHSMSPGGFKQMNYERMHSEKPNRVIELAVKGMLPKNNALTHNIMKKLKVYKGSEHPHAAQQPVKLEL